METPYPAYRGNEPYVFVCYSHDDTADVFRELQLLREVGINVYYDEGISPGHEWTQELADAIDGCIRFLFFVSPSSVASRHCRNEVQYALEKAKPLISVHLGPTELPGGLQLSIGSAQAIRKYELGTKDYERKLSQALGLSAPELGQRAEVPSNGPTARRWPVVVAISALLILVAVGLWSGRQERPPEKHGSAEMTEASSPPKLAVLPFVNLSDDPNQEYFSDGVSEDILTALSRQPRLTVRARQSSFYFRGREADPREIADALNVTYLINGSVRMQGNRVRVTVRLTDVISNEDIWTQRYDRDLSDVFEVQDEIARTVATELGAQFSATERRIVDTQAYDAFLLGRQYFFRQAFGPAADTLRRAIELDPSYADAHALLARVYETEAWNQPRNLQRLLELGENHISRALQLDPKHPLALGLRANSPTTPLQQAIDELHGLVSQFPNDEAVLFFYSTKIRQIGRRDLEMKIFDRQSTIDPLSAQCPIPALAANLFYGRLSEAVHLIERCEAMGVSYPVASVDLALLRGDLDTAKREVDRPPADWSAVPALWRSIYAALVAYVRNDPEGIELALGPVTDDLGGETSYAQYWAALLRGDTRAALQHYASALRQGEPLAFYFVRGSVLHRKLFPEFFESERYDEMLKTYGLDSEAIANVKIPLFPF